MAADITRFNELRRIAADMKASFALYDCTHDEMFNVTGTTIKKSTVPEAFKPYLNDRKKLSVRFNGAGATVVVHFLRFEIGADTHVLILKDNAENEKLLLFFNTAVMLYLTSAKELEMIKEEKEKELSELTHTATILRDSRRKHLALVDGIHIPIYSVDADYKVLYANKAFAKFVGVPTVKDVVGICCHKLIFGNDKPCTWCLYNAVTEKKIPVTSEFSAMRNQKAVIFDFTMFPVMKDDGSGEFSEEHGAFLIDKTEKVAMLNSINKFRETVKAFKMTNLSSINEVSEVKSAYEELRKQYEMLEERYASMMDTLDFYISSDSGKRINELQMMIDELDVRFRRAKDTSINLRAENERMHHKTAVLHERITSQVEQFLDALNKKAPSFVASSDYQKFTDEFAEIKKQMTPNTTAKK